MRIMSVFGRTVKVYNSPMYKELHIPAYMFDKLFAQNAQNEGVRFKYCKHSYKRVLQVNKRISRMMGLN